MLILCNKKLHQRLSLITKVPSGLCQMNRSIVNKEFHHNSWIVQNFKQGFWNSKPLEFGKLSIPEINQIGGTRLANFQVFALLEVPWLHLTIFDNECQETRLYWNIAALITRYQIRNFIISRVIRSFCVCNSDPETLLFRAQTK